MKLTNVHLTRRNQFNKRRHGFTLIEVVLSLGLLALLSVSILLIISALSNVSVAIAESHERFVLSEDFEGYVERTFSQLGPDSTLLLEKTADQKLQQLSIRQPNTYFILDGEDVVAEELIIFPSFNKNGLVDMVIEQSNTLLENDSGKRRITLLEDLNALQWVMYNKRSRSWVSEWRPGGDKPAMIKLIYRTVDDEATKTLLIVGPNNEGN